MAEFFYGPSEPVSTSGTAVVSAFRLPPMDLEGIDRVVVSAWKEVPLSYTFPVSGFPILAPVAPAGVVVSDDYTCRCGHHKLGHSLKLVHANLCGECGEACDVL